MSDEIDFGKFLAELRKEKGYTQLQLAEIMHVTDKTISRWENNPGYLDIDTMKQLSEIFDITMDELYAAKRLSREIFIKHRRRKRILMAVISFLFLIFTFLAFYFVANYNSVKFYTLYIKNSNFDIRGGYYLDTKSRNLFQISKIEYLGDEKINDLYIELYEEDGTSLYSGITKNDIYVELTEDINVDKLHMKVTYTIEDKKYEDDLKLNYRINYKNNKFIDLDSDSTNQEYSSIDNDRIETLEELGYKPYSDTTYLKEEKDKETVIKKYFNLYSNYYNELYQYKDGKVFKIIYLLDSDRISFQLYDNKNIILEEFNYSYEKNIIICLTKRCGKWDDIIEDVKGEISALESIFN